MFKKALIAAAAVAAMTAATAADFKVGVVNPGRILSESAPAVAAQNKLKSYFNQRSQEESQIILSRANRIIQDIAKSQNYDLILQEAVWASPKADLTEQVIKRLNAPTK